MTNVQEKALDISKETNMIWTIANRLRGAYKADKYRDTIIPMTIIRRFPLFRATRAPTTMSSTDRLFRDISRPI